MGFFQNFDFLKSPIFLLYKGQATLSTRIGFLFSALLFVLLINNALHSDFFYRKKPSISVQSDYRDSYAKMIFSRSNFSVAVKLADYTGKSVIDYSYFYFNVTYNMYNASTESVSRNMKFMKICEETDLPEEAKPLNLSGKSFCPSQNENLVLGGFLTSPNTNYAIFQLNRCDNESEKYFNVTCKSQAEMDQYILSKIYYMYYTDNTFDLNDFENPIHRSFVSSLMYFYPNIKKSTKMPVQKAMIYTDLGTQINISSLPDFF